MSLCCAKPWVQWGRVRVADERIWKIRRQDGSPKPV